MTRDEAINIAEAVAEREGWIWIEPVQAIRFRRWFLGSVCWEIISNAESRGCNVRVTIEEKSKKVCRKSFLAR
jgi:hypothetical protein